MPPKIVNSQDMKPFPVLWHEDNRRQQARERPQVSGAISGFRLGEASHRLVINSLQHKPNTRLPNGPNWDSPYMVNRPRPAGPLGYERGFQHPNNYYTSSPYPQDFSNPKQVKLFSETQGSTQNARIQERLNSQDHYYNSRSNLEDQNYMRRNSQDQFYNIRSSSQDHQQNMQTGMSNLTIEEGSRSLPHGRPMNAGICLNQQPPAGFWSNQQQQIQSPGPPPSLPPTNWIDREQMVGYTSGFKQDMSPYGQQQVNWVYRIKPRDPENPTTFANQK